MIQFAKFYAEMDAEERRLFARILTQYSNRSFSTKVLGEELGYEVDERGRGRNWISQFLKRMDEVVISVRPFRRHGDRDHGTIHDGFSDRKLVIRPEEYDNHVPYLLNMPAYVVREAIHQLEIDPELEQAEQQLADLERQRQELLDRVSDLRNKGKVPEPRGLSRELVTQ